MRHVSCHLNLRPDPALDSQVSMTPATSPDPQKLTDELPQGEEAVCVPPSFLPSQALWGAFNEVHGVSGKTDPTACKGK